MTESLFFALQPDVTAITQIQQVSAGLCAQHDLSTRFITADRLHVTLHFVGDLAALSQDQLEHAHAAAAAIKLPAFELSFDKVLSFRSAKSERPLVLASNASMTALQLFRYELGDQLRRRGVPADKTVFTPHITLAYDKYAVEEQILAVPVKWTAREFVLIKSFVGKSRYEVLGRWPLGAA
ncbi:RNA 2',3'-cyclic phosphodiesterase [Herminiimonas aquatilis]|uniref:RNA 2',3'-cyclic phosphodiesterase n=1 Tax=Herminiimonas aquatilis TaxID=345342 RepID=A0ABW2J7X8_9BURK